MDHLFEMHGSLQHPVTRWILWGIGGALVLAPMLMLALARSSGMSAETRADVWRRYRTWLWILPAVIGPILLCPAGAIGVVLVMSLVCYREYARATGLFRHRALSAIVALAILSLTGACLAYWYGFFVAITPITIAILAAVAVLPDQPKGYIQRVALAATALLFFGTGLQHLAYLAHDPLYRPILLTILAVVQLNDILAYCVGKAIGRRKLFPNTSPNKTLGGHLGAAFITAPLAAFLAHHIYPGTALDRPLPLLAFGLILAVGGQLGDLTISSIKRDLGIKDMDAVLPGHGGFLDRFNSLLLVAPAAFHYLAYIVGIGVRTPAP